jgi:hypothetical protein
LATISAITGEFFVYLESMISSEEFQQTLQSGQIHEALALLVRDPVVDITTRLNEDPLDDSQTINHSYIRTKINLLTGEIQNEVGKGFVANCSGYLKLQQLHIDQVVASDRAVQGYFDQLKAILTTLSPKNLASINVPQPLPGCVEPSRLNTNSLIARLTEAAALSTQNLGASSSDTPLSSLTADSTQSSSAPIDADIEEDIDLSIEAEGEVWEEWVEDEDFSSESMLFQPAASMISKPDSEENWVRRHLNSIDLKSQNHHNATESANITNQWDQFTPDWIDLALPPQTAKNSDVLR